MIKNCFVWSNLIVFNFRRWTLIITLEDVHLNVIRYILISCDDLPFRLSSLISTHFKLRSAAIRKNVLNCGRESASKLNPLITSTRNFTFHAVRRIRNLKNFGVKYSPKNYCRLLNNSEKKPRTEIFNSLIIFNLLRWNNRMNDDE